LSNFSYRVVTLSGRSRPILAVVPPEELELLSDFLSSPALPQAAIETAIVVAMTATAARRIRVFTLKPP
jgi:multisubunit Na+/H+ antiporter MnhC subunit